MYRCMDVCTYAVQVSSESSDIQIHFLKFLRWIKRTPPSLTSLRKQGFISISCAIVHHTCKDLMFAIAKLFFSFSQRLFFCQLSCPNSLILKVSGNLPSYTNDPSHWLGVTNRFLDTSVLPSDLLRDQKVRSSVFARELSVAEQGETECQFVLHTFFFFLFS